MSNMIDHVVDSLEKAEKLESKLNKDVLSIDGMIGNKTRHFYNNICSMEDCRYLEIGVWKGSSFCAAIYNNNTKSVCVDNWTEFGGPKDEFTNNLNTFKGNNDITYMENDCWKINPSELDKFNVYMYDGNHDETSHYKALVHFLPCLDDKFIFMVDDWSWTKTVKNPTMKAIEDLKLNILYQKEIISSNDGGGWWNGIGIFVLSK